MLNAAKTGSTKLEIVNKADLAKAKMCSIKSKEINNKKRGRKASDNNDLLSLF